MNNSMRLEFDSLSQNEQFARSVIAAFILPLNPSLDELGDVKTAVSEAVTNAVIHGYSGGEGTVIMEAELCGRTLTVTVADSGRGIDDIEKARKPLYSGCPEQERSGMGFTIMESFMDEVRVKSESGRGTAVTMVKTIGVI